MATETPVRPSLTDAQLPELMSLLRGSDSVELKLTVPANDHRATAVALGTGIAERRWELAGDLHAAVSHEQVERAAEVFAAHGVTDRCEAIACDFLQSVPDRGDVYILSNILHDWDDEHSVKILERVHEACAPGARVMVVEFLLPDDRDGVNPDAHVPASSSRRFSR